MSTCNSTHSQAELGIVHELPALELFNQRVSRWASRFDPPLQRAAYTVGVAMDMETHSFRIPVESNRRRRGRPPRYGAARHHDLLSKYEQLHPGDTISKATFTRRLTPLLKKGVVTRWQDGSGWYEDPSGRRVREAAMTRADFSRVIVNGQVVSHDFESDVTDNETGKLCAQCDKPVKARRADARFCSAACQKAAKRASVRDNVRDNEPRRHVRDNEPGKSRLPEGDVRDNEPGNEPRNEPQSTLDYSSLDDGAPLEGAPVPNLYQAIIGKILGIPWSKVNVPAVKPTLAQLQSEYEDVDIFEALEWFWPQVREKVQANPVGYAITIWPRACSEYEDHLIDVAVAEAQAEAAALAQAEHEAAKRAQAELKATWPEWHLLRKAEEPTVDGETWTWYTDPGHTIRSEQRPNCRNQVALDDDEYQHALAEWNFEPIPVEINKAVQDKRNAEEADFMAEIHAKAEAQLKGETINYWFKWTYTMTGSGDQLRKSPIEWTGHAEYECPPGSGLETYDDHLKARVCWDQTERFAVWLPKPLHEARLALLRGKA
jgi:hypothetical protein